MNRIQSAIAGKSRTGRRIVEGVAAGGVGAAAGPEAELARAEAAAAIAWELAVFLAPGAAVVSAYRVER